MHITTRQGSVQVPNNMTFSQVALEQKVVVRSGQVIGKGYSWQEAIEDLTAKLTQLEVAHA